MFNGAEQPFILLWCPYLCQRGFKLFVCTLCLCVFVCEYVRAPSDWLSGLRIWARDAIPFSVCLPFISAAALSCLYSLQLCFLTPFLTKNITSALILLLAISYSAPLISATSLLHTLCSLSAVFLDMWGTEAVCASNLASPLSFLFSPSLSSPVSHPRVSLWMQLTVWSAVGSWLWKK